MQSSNLAVIATILSSAVSIITLPPVATAAELGCSFNSQLDTSSYSYNVTATTNNSCISQLLQISVHKSGIPFTQLITPSATIVEKVWLADINDDSRHELIVISHEPADETKKTMQLFVVDGNILKQVRFPAPPDMTGYRGGDSYMFEGERIIRVFPVYLPGDHSGSPTGGERKIVYQYRNKELLLGSAIDVVKQTTSRIIKSKDVKFKNQKSQALKISSIKPMSDYIEIQANGSIENYKVTRIDDPPRLVVDIAGVGLGFQNKTVVINRHGVSTARIGEHKGFVRIVFDATVTPMPTETVTPAENALRIGFFPNTSK